MSLSFKLFRLQQIDTSLDKGQERLSDINRLLEDDLEIRLAQQKVDHARKKNYESEKNLRLAEENVKQQRIKIERSQAALYGGKISNPKELQDLQHESEALRKYLVTLEDLQLEAMLEMDEAASQLAEAQTSFAVTEDQFSAKKEVLARERSELIHDLEVNESERTAALSNIEAPVVRQYEKFRKQKNGIAVARIVDKTCAACGSTLTASTYSSAKIPTTLTRCDACGRILYAG